LHFLICFLPVLCFALLYPVYVLVAPARAHMSCCGNGSQECRRERKGSWSCGNKYQALPSSACGVPFLVDIKGRRGG
jgi:hypothetical protein